MQKISLAITAACLSGLSSCIPPEPQPTSPYGGPYGPVSPYNDISPPPAPGFQPPVAPTPPAAPPSVGGYPTGRPTANPQEVLSPYEPYNVINVEGFKSGELVRDPSNRKIFRVP